MTCILLFPHNHPVMMTSLSAYFGSKASASNGHRKRANHFLFGSYFRCVSLLPVKGSVIFFFKPCLPHFKGGQAFVSSRPRKFEGLLLKFSHNAHTISAVTISVAFLAISRSTNMPSCRKYRSTNL